MMLLPTGSIVARRSPKADRSGTQPLRYQQISASRGCCRRGQPDCVGSKGQPDSVICRRWPVRFDSRTLSGELSPTRPAMWPSTQPDRPRQLQSSPAQLVTVADRRDDNHAPLGASIHPVVA